MGVAGMVSGLAGVHGECEPGGDGPEGPRDKGRRARRVPDGV